MIDSVRGTLLHAEPRLAVVECGGVGFACSITMNTARELPAQGEEVRLYTVLNVREDAMELFGFAEQTERRCFQQLITVTGVGPKAALAILSELSPDRLALAITGGDYKAITRAQGVGPKLAQRVVLELKDKIGVPTGDAAAMPQTAGVVSAAGGAAEAVNALTVLGFSASEASAAVGRLDSALPVNELVRQALKSLAQKG